MGLAAFFGHLDILIRDYNSCIYAAEKGNLECLKYLHENGCPWNENCSKYASKYGHLEVLKYLHENGCLWNEDCCEYASSNGHLEVLKYLNDNGCPRSVTCVHQNILFGLCKIWTFRGIEISPRKWMSLG